MLYFKSSELASKISGMLSFSMHGEQPNSAYKLTRYMELAGRLDFINGIRQSMVSANSRGNYKDLSERLAKLDVEKKEIKNEMMKLSREKDMVSFLNQFLK